jgi:glycosyltransferase involved in cell wall biosynthesis
MSVLDRFAGCRILLLNWRDLSNPQAGGAEEYAEQIARRFARAGALLTLFTSQYEAAPPYDWAREYLVVREGGRFGVYLAAARHLERYGRRYDAIIDFQNGIPFFAPVWAPAIPMVCVVHHVHQKQFDMYFRWPVNRVGRLLEGRVSREIYRHVPLIAVSPSTRAEMRRQLGLRGPIHIVPNGVDPLSPGQLPRSPAPSIAVVTRLVPHKQLHLLVDALPALVSRWPDLHVDIAGTGPARADLASQVSRLGLQKTVSLPGRVPEQDRSDLLSRAWLTVACSLAEGWGLTVLEANTLGTPAVAYDVPGLRDSVRDGWTGWLVPASHDLTPTLINAMTELADPARRRFYATEAQRWARRFSWDASAERLASVLLGEMRWRRNGRPSRRRAVDISTIASWPAEAIGAMDGHLHRALRLTDALSTGEHGIRALLNGCDEVGAAQALQRILVPPTSLHLATTTQVLCGTGEDGLA